MPDTPPPPPRRRYRLLALAAGTVVALLAAEVLARWLGPPVLGSRVARYNFELADTDALFAWFDTCEQQAGKLVELGLPLPAYEQVLKASHTFNLLDARRAISVTERQRFILRVRDIAKAVAGAYYTRREEMGFPGLKGAAHE